MEPEVPKILALGRREGAGADNKTRALPFTFLLRYYVFDEGSGELPKFTAPLIKTFFAFGELQMF